MSRQHFIQKVDISKIVRSSFFIFDFVSQCLDLFHEIRPIVFLNGHYNLKKSNFIRMKNHLSYHINSTALSSLMRTRCWNYQSKSNLLKVYKISELLFFTPCSTTTYLYLKNLINGCKAWSGQRNCTILPFIPHPRSWKCAVFFTKKLYEQFDLSIAVAHKIFIA